jgi:hypothetical protein
MLLLVIKGNISRELSGKKWFKDKLFYMDVGSVVFTFDQVPSCNIAVKPVSILPRKPVWVLKGQ